MQGVRGIATVLCLVGGAFGAAPASAAEQLGTATFPGACNQGTTWVQGDSVTGADYRANAPGVVTSWSTAAGTLLNTYQFMVLRPDGGTTAPFGYTPMQKDSLRTLTTMNAVNTFSGLHIPINTGETIGFFVPAPQPMNNGTCASVAPPGNSIQSFPGDPPFGVSSAFNAPQNNLRMNLAATVEPDADRDGFGDETQDACPAQAAVQTACPIVPLAPVTPPATKKCKRKKAKSKGSASAAAKKRGCKKKRKK